MDLVVVSKSSSSTMGLLVGFFVLVCGSRKDGLLFNFLSRILSKYEALVGLVVNVIFTGLVLVLVLEEEAWTPQEVVVIDDTSIQK